MNLTERINEDIRLAMKAGEKEKLDALRAVKAAILLANTERKGAQLSQDDELKLLQKLVKQRKEAADIYRQQSREDLFKVEDYQAKVIEKYLPEQLSGEEIDVIIRQIIASTGASSQKDMGKVMGLASKQLAGKADNKMLAEKVKSLLGA
ncbi:MAG: GatB/YqeY domain-containing protein [Bacteroidia bacterium]|nr:GatB/YqeY domain-containing protein [Bacteroidia bacterium]